jgi:hypothetical protein
MMALGKKISAGEQGCPKFQAVPGVELEQTHRTTSHAGDPDYLRTA